MNLFMPQKVIFDIKALKYQNGENMYKLFLDNKIEIVKSNSNQVMKHINGNTENQILIQAKKILLVTVSRVTHLTQCKPSADYEFSIVSNCPGGCEYCYLQGKKTHRPYLKVFANIEEILNSVKMHIIPDKKETTFEVSSLGDPLSLEHITGSLGKTIEFFGVMPKVKLRVVSKFNYVDTLLYKNHNNKTHFRFSINTYNVIKNFEHNTASLEERIIAASKILNNGYSLGFIIAPLMVYENWKKDYTEVFKILSKYIKSDDLKKPLHFEFIQHRFTPNDKIFLLDRFPNTKLNLSEKNRTLRYTKFGTEKFVYNKEVSSQIKEHMTSLVNKYYSGSIIEYFV